VAPPSDVVDAPQPVAVPPAREARRIQGVGVPLVAAALVAGIGLPLTALAVSLVDRSNQDPGPLPVDGRARLSGAVTADGAASPVGCRPGAPVVLTVGSSEVRYSILLSVPTGATAGTYRLQPGTGTFVTVSQAATQRAWTSQGRAGATGEITLRRDGGVSARFSGLEPNSASETGTVDGAVEARCG